MLIKKPLIPGSLIYNVGRFNGTETFSRLLFTQTFPRYEIVKDKLIISLSMQLAAQGLGETDISVPWEVRVLIFLRHKLLYGICDNIE